MKRLPMRKIRDVLRLSAEGLSTSQIAASLAIGRTTLRGYLDRASELGLAWPLPAEMSDTVSGKFFTQMRPLFPSYIFVALDILQGGWRAVNSTYGITRLVSLSKEPTPVPLDLVNQLMLRYDMRAYGNLRASIRADV